METNTSERSVNATPVRLGLRANWQQFALLILINAFVGGMVGIERTVVPLIGSKQFHIASTTLIVSFIVSFGVVKAFANLVSGQLADTWGRKRVLVLGWFVGFPVPFMIIWAPTWGWIIAANALLGINQGLAWSMTVIMKVDLVGPKSRGLAVGLNEFAGYLAVGVTAFLTGFLASQFGLRPVPIYLGVGYAVGGAILSILLVRDTRDHVALETSGHAQPSAPISFREVFALTSFKDRNLFAASQAGLVNNLNDGMSWGIFPLFYASFGLGVERIGMLKAIYPATWGILQVATGPLSDRLGRKGLIVTGMWVQAGGLLLTATTHQFRWWLAGSLLLGLGTAMVYPSLIAAVSDASHPAWRPLAERLPVLAGPGLCDRRALRRPHRRHLRNVDGDLLDSGPDIHLRRGRRRADAQSTSHRRWRIATVSGVKQMARTRPSAIASAVLLWVPGTAWAQNPSYPCGYAHGPGMMGWGGGWSGIFMAPFFMILGLAGLVAVTVLLVRWIGGLRQGVVSNHTAQQTPLEILKERYARGEIDKEEYDERRRVLSE